MARHKLVVLTNATPGQDAAFRQWYIGRHLDDVVRFPGFVSAQLYENVDGAIDPEPEYRYYAEYEMESDDPAADVRELYSRFETPDLPGSGALAEQRYSGLYVAISAVVKK